VTPLWLHAYSGRESGLMVIGDPDSMRALGRQLLDGRPIDGVTAQGWPTQIARPTVVGPYGDVHGFQLSFHLKGDRALQEVVPIPRRAFRLPLIALFSVCTAVGAYTIVTWLIHVL
jgi:hypothetical protein